MTGINKILKRFIQRILVVGVFVFTSCADNSYKGYVSIIEEPDEESIPVMISVGNPEFNSSDTRGIGAIDQTDNASWHDAYIYIYSFKRDMATDYSILGNEDDEMCLIDASTGESRSKQGRKAKINKNETYISWVDSKNNVFYHNNNLPYDFFGYYIDDIDVTENDVLRNKESIQLKVKIDGTQDLMSARAGLTDEQINRKDFSDEEKANIKDWYYSFYTAQRNVQPVMIFKHHLSRFIFQMYPVTEEANRVSIDEIRIKSKQTGLFTVVSSAIGNMGVDFSADQPYEDLFLTESKGEPLSPGVYHTDYQGDFSESLYERPFVRVGESIMLPPGEMEYQCTVLLKETRNGKEYAYESPVTLTNGNEVFKSGTQYIVKLGIWGLRDIDVNVTPEPWEDGGSIVIDPDKDFGKDDIH